MDDIGQVAAKIIISPSYYINKSFELTNNEKLTFSEMASQLSNGLDKKINYISSYLILFRKAKRKNALYAHYGYDNVALFSEISKKISD